MMAKFIPSKFSLIPFLIAFLMIPRVFAQETIPAANPAGKALIPPAILALQVPSKNGHIMEYHPGSKPFTIYYIQDAHVNIEAQKNIAKLIELLIQRKQVRLVCVEGGIGDVSLTEYRVGTKEKRVDVAERLLKEGKISGEEYLNFVEDYPLLLWGIESQVLYDENLIAFTKVEPLISATMDSIYQVGGTLESLKKVLYPKEYYELEGKLRTFSDKHDLQGEATLLFEYSRKQNIKIESYPNIQTLSSLIDIEAGADFERVDYERTQLVRELTRRLPKEKLKNVLDLEAANAKENDPLKRAEFYEALIQVAKDNTIPSEKFGALRAAVPYLREQNKIDSIAFFNEKEGLEKEIALKYLTTEEAKKLYQMSADLVLLESLVKLELVPEKYQMFMSERERFKIAGWASFLNTQADQAKISISLPADLAKLDDTLDSFQSFYRIANIRDQALVENLTEKVKQEKEAELVLIAGGFHKDRLVKKLTRIGFNVVIISPNVGIEQGPELYRKMLTEKWENGRWFIKEDKPLSEKDSTS